MSIKENISYDRVSETSDYKALTFFVIKKHYRNSNISIEQKMKANLLSLHNSGFHMLEDFHILSYNWNKTKWRHHLLLSNKDI